MNRVRVFTLFIIVAATSVSMFGCGLVGSWRASSDSADVNTVDEIPEWLTITHRAQVSEEPDTETDEDSTQPAPATVPSVTQPAATQPAQQTEQPAPTGETPKWQQQGTMEYIAKQRLDQLVFSYKRLNSDIADLEAKKVKSEEDMTDLIDMKKARETMYKDVLLEIAIGIGLDLEKEYGIKPPPITSDSSNSTWLHNWDESPSEFKTP